MSWTSIVTEIEIQFIDQCRYSNSRSLTNNIVGLRSHIFCNVLHCCLFIMTTLQDNLCIKMLNEVVSHPCEMGSRPTTCRSFRADMQANPGAASSRKLSQ